MAATQNVQEHPHVRNLSAEITPRHGVVTLSGYGIHVQVDRGHLLLADGIGCDRRKARFARVGHGLKRLIMIGSNGIVSLSALRWLADQDVAFVMLNRNGSVLATTGPVRPSDARLRRAQALALHSDVGLRIARGLIDQKLAAQEALARNRLSNQTSANAIADARAELPKANTGEEIRFLESRAASAYWSAWRSLPITYPKVDSRRIPDHWRTFGARCSPLTGSPRLAVNPPNAMLNYLYAVLESESRLALAALGLDPGIGVLHLDTPRRDSLACDLMEPVRPNIDAYLLDWIGRQPLRRDWFFEQRDGNCRLMGSFASRLAESSPTWGRAVAPFAEWIAQTLWSTRSKSARAEGLATRLTQRNRCQTKGGMGVLSSKAQVRPPAVCHQCGVAIKSGRNYCPSCAVSYSREGLMKAAKLGRISGHSPEACARQAEKQHRHAAAVRAWNPADKPTWLTEEICRTKIQPRLLGITVSAIASALGISGPYAAEIRAGRYLPHPRHWQALARLGGVTEGP